MEDIFTKYKCIGILGGTFNPIHNGHIELAKCAIEQYSDIEQIIIIPNNKPAYKSNNGLVTANDRYNMIKAATSNLDYVTVSDIEIKRGGLTYSYDTICEIKKINPDINIYFIVGADSLFTVDTWYKFDEFLSMVTLLVANRDSDMIKMQQCADNLMTKYDNISIKFLNNLNISVSSSMIRECDIDGRLAKEYLPCEVISYIKANKLYK